MNDLHSFYKAAQIEEELLGYWDKFPEFITNPYARNVVGSFFSNHKIRQYDWNDKNFGELLAIFNHAAKLDFNTELKVYDLPNFYKLFWTDEYSSDEKPYLAYTDHYRRTHIYLGVHNARKYYLELQKKAVENGLEEDIDAWLAGVPASDIVI